MSEEDIKNQKLPDDISLKQDILNKMFLNLSKESLFDIADILNGYVERVNRSGKDTLLARCMFAYGYHSANEFKKQLNITKDDSKFHALSNEITRIEVLNDLRHCFGIDDNTFVRIVKEITEQNER